MTPPQAFKAIVTPALILKLLVKKRVHILKKHAVKSYRCVYAPLLFSVAVCMFWEIAIAALPTFPEKLLGMSWKLLCWIKYLVSLNSTHGGSHVGLVWKITISGRPKKLSKTLLIHMKKFIFIKIAFSSSKPSVVNPCQKEQYIKWSRFNRNISAAQVMILKS